MRKPIGPSKRFVVKREHILAVHGQGPPLNRGALMIDHNGRRIEVTRVYVSGRNPMRASKYIDGVRKGDYALPKKGRPYLIRR
jgi:hypothetical protein